MDEYEAIGRAYQAYVDRTKSAGVPLPLLNMEQWGLKQLAEARALLKALVDDPWAGKFNDIDYGVGCAYCGLAAEYGQLDHDEDCPIEEARRWLAGKGEDS
jgi:hypothetical protein